MFAPLTIQHQADGGELVRFMDCRLVCQPSDDVVNWYPLVERMKNFRKENANQKMVENLRIDCTIDDNSRYDTFGSVLICADMAGFYPDLPALTRGQLLFRAGPHVEDNFFEMITPKGQHYGRFSQNHLVRPAQVAVEPETIKIFMNRPGSRHPDNLPPQPFRIGVPRKPTKKTPDAIDEWWKIRPNDPPLNSLADLRAALAAQFQQSTDAGLAASETRINIGPESEITWGEVRRVCTMAADLGFRWLVLCVPR